jgi:class 3 adenylate cyclase
MASGRNVRRLFVIMADVAGYSLLMGADEDGALIALTAHRGASIDPAAAEHADRIVKTTGDGLLVESPVLPTPPQTGVATPARARTFLDKNPRLFGRRDKVLRRAIGHYPSSSFG